MGTFLNESGEEVEAFTPEEVETKINEAKTGLIPATEVEAVKTQLNSLQEEKQQLEAKLKESIKNDDKGGEDVINKLKADLESKISGIQESLVSNERNQIIAQIANGDAELIKKITVEFDNVKGGDIKERVLKAYKIVADNPSPNIMNNIAGAGGKGSPANRSSEEKESDNSKALRNVLGISDEDVKKYGNK